MPAATAASVTGVVASARSRGWRRPAGRAIVVGLVSGYSAITPYAITP
ncbi:MAG: hypothetical protein ACLQK8_25105 [Streptosporangiaceae bacterium]